MRIFVCMNWISVFVKKNWISVMTNMILFDPWEKINEIWSVINLNWTNAIWKKSNRFYVDVVIAVKCGENVVNRKKSSIETKAFTRLTAARYVEVFVMLPQRQWSIQDMMKFLLNSYRHIEHSKYNILDVKIERTRLFFIILLIKLAGIG